MRAIRYNLLKSLDMEFEENILISQNGNTLLVSESILLIKGKTGSCKSYLALSLVAGLMGGEDGIGFTYPDKSKKKIAYFSTEMSKAECLMRIQRLAKSCSIPKKNLELLEVIDLNQVEDNDKIEEIKSICNELKPDVIVIDILGDLVDDFNDNKESKQVYSILSQLALKDGCSMIGVMHQNEGTDNQSPAQGHFGRRVEKKISGGISINKKGSNDEKELIMTKVRRGRPGDKIGITFNTDESKPFLISITEQNDSLFDQIEFPIKNKEFEDILKKLYPKATTNITYHVKKHINHWQAEGLIIVQKMGKETIYSKIIK